MILLHNYDSRDNIFNPTRGLHFSQSWKIVGGPLMGDDKYMKYITDISKYFRTFWKFVLVCHLNLGLIDRSFDGEPIKISSEDLLYLGGVESLRGYDYWDPQFKGGGVARIYSNIEYRYPIAEQILWGVFFLDGGNLWNKQYLMNVDLREYWFSTGFGFRIQIPMIPIRLYFSKRFNYDNMEKKVILQDKTIANWRFDFSVGGLF